MIACGHRAAQWGCDARHTAKCAGCVLRVEIDTGILRGEKSLPRGTSLCLFGVHQALGVCSVLNCSATRILPNSPNCIKARRKAVARTIGLTIVSSSAAAGCCRLLVSLMDLLTLLKYVYPSLSLTMNGRRSTTSNHFSNRHCWLLTAVTSNLLLRFEGWRCWLALLARFPESATMDPLA